MAPEVLNNKPYTHKADVYSFAIVLYEIITWKTPYLGKQPMQVVMAVVNDNARPDLSYVPSDCPKELIALMV